MIFVCNYIKGSHLMSGAVCVSLVLRTTSDSSANLLCPEVSSVQVSGPVLAILCGVM